MQGRTIYLIRKDFLRPLSERISGRELLKGGSLQYSKGNGIIIELINASWRQFKSLPRRREKLKRVIPFRKQQKSYLQNLSSFPVLFYLSFLLIAYAICLFFYLCNNYCSTCICS